MAGELHYHLNIWKFILEDFHKRDEILSYIKNGVSVFDFFKHFKGGFKGKSYDSPYPPRTFIPNSKICGQYEDFISSTIIERVQNGSMPIWGKQGECEALQSYRTYLPASMLTHVFSFFRQLITRPLSVCLTGREV